MPAVIVCPSCDLVHCVGAAPSNERTVCARCGGLLQRAENGSIDTAIALAVSALVLFAFSNAYPLVAIQSNGSGRATTLMGAARGLYQQGHVLLASLVFFTTIAAPFLQITSLLYLLVPLRGRRKAPGQRIIFRLMTQIRPWIFVEVFMLGALVALVRLAAFARVVPGVALWSCALLMFTLTALTSRTSPGQFWRWVEERRA
ncbi:MAG: paraquat-inducible protein A [Pseudomonadota bacterium]|nr:paraquat-inducible protein A [Pseudomonadota bacterium]